MKVRLIFSIILFLSVIVSCTDDFESYNTDEKHSQEVSGDVLFTDAQIKLADRISSTNVNRNIWKLIAQYWTERSYTDEANYNIVNRAIPDDIWETYYAILKSLEEAKEYINEESVSFESDQINKDNRMAIIELVEVFIYQRLVDAFGDIPYSEALDTENYTPVYDDAATIYQDLISRATAAVESLDSSEGSFDTADLLYSGDVDSWTKFGYSLLVKMGIGIAEGTLSALGQSTVEAAYDKVFTSMDDGAYFPYQESLPYVNPLYTDLVASGRHDFVMVTGMVELMDSLADPRIDNYFDNLEDGILTDYGASGGSYSTKVHYDEAIDDPDFNGFIMTFEEVEFYLAEAAARGWSVGSSAEEYFNDAVTNSIVTTWGGTEAEAAAYLATNPYVTDANSPYSDWKEAIGTQAWLAMYTRGFIGYTFYRRLDNPDILVMPPNPPTGVDEIITRFTYPVSEQTLNSTNYTSASEAIGGDDLTTRIFWDVE